MTLSESILWSFVRSVAIASLAIWPMCILLNQIEGSTSIRWRRTWLLLSVFPFFVPELLIGFHYRLTATQLSSGASPWVAAFCNETLYLLLQVSRCMAVGVAVSMLFPDSQVTRESLFSWNWLRSFKSLSNWCLGWLRLQIAGPWQRMLVSWSLMALIAFQEFETAALMQIDRHPIAWSVWLFDAHAAGQPLSESLRMILVPLFCELLLLSPAIYLLMKTRSSELVVEHRDSMVCLNCTTFRARAIGIACLTPGMVLFIVWPVLANIRTTLSGMIALLSQTTRLQQSLEQLLTSVGFAVGATILSMNLASMILQSGQTRGQFRVQRLSICLVFPGLVGGLVVSLLLLSFFQLTYLSAFYDSWLPMLLGQTLVVLPKSMAIVFLLRRTLAQSSLYSAKLLMRSDDRMIRRHAAGLLWRMTTSRWLLGALVILHWCFWDVTVASVLRPVQLEPVVTRLYNEMHYGRTEALMSLSMLAGLAPFAVGGFVMLASFLRATLFIATSPVASTVRPELAGKS